MNSDNSMIECKIGKFGIKTPVIVRFEGIDQFDRPIFKDVDTNTRYGSTHLLFSYRSQEAEVLDIINEEDLSYFGDKFGCVPIGTSCNVKIAKPVSYCKKETPTGSRFLAILHGFQNDEHKGYAAYIILHEEIKKAIDEFGETKTRDLMKGVFGEGVWK